MKAHIFELFVKLFVFFAQNAFLRAEAGYVAAEIVNVACNVDFRHKDKHRKGDTQGGEQKLVFA